jgi:hypothetical protein
MNFVGAIQPFSEQTHINLDLSYCSKKVMTILNLTQNNPNLVQMLKYAVEKAILMAMMMMMTMMMVRSMLKMLFFSCSGGASMRLKPDFQKQPRKNLQRKTNKRQITASGEEI